MRPERRLILTCTAAAALIVASCSTPTPGSQSTLPASTTTAPVPVATTVVTATTSTMPATTTEAPPPTVQPNGVVEQIAISGFSFKPAAITVEPGTTIVWTNQDGASHTATAAEGAFRTGTIALDASSEVVIGGPGVYEYFCSIHPEMRATITVEG